MSIAQFDSASAKRIAAQTGQSNVTTTSNSDFARLLSEAQIHAQNDKLQSTRLADTQREDERRVDAAATATADQRTAARKADAAADKTGSSKASDAKTSETDGTDKAHDARHGHHSTATGNTTDASATATADSLAAPIVPAVLTTATTQTTADAASSTDGTGDGTTDGTGSAADAAAAAGTTTADTTAAANTDTALADPALATLATLGLGRSAVPGAGTNVPPAAGKIAAANVSVARAPAAVKLSPLTTALPQEIDGDPAEANAPANPTTVAQTPANPSAAAAAAATDPASGAAIDPNAPTAPGGFASALATAAATITTTEAPPVAVAVAATTTDHASLFAQGSSTDATTTGTTLTDGAAPAAAGFATVNAGTTVSRAETAQDNTQNGQTGQTPLPLPAEQLAIAINKNAGRDGSQNFTIRLSPEKLGSVEVQLKVDSKGKTTANFVVEHAETLGLLKQDSQQLVQSLQNAGIDTNGASLSFSLRDPNSGSAQNQSGNGGQGRQSGGLAGNSIDGTDAAEQPAVASNRLYDFKA